MSQGQNNTPLLLFRCLPGFHLGIFFTNRRAQWSKSVSTNQLTSALLMLPFFYDKLYNYLSRLLSCAFSGYCRLFLYMSSKHYVRQGKKAFVQQYQKLYRLLMKVSMVFSICRQAKGDGWLCTRYYGVYYSKDLSSYQKCHLHFTLSPLRLAGLYFSNLRHLTNSSLQHCP